MKIYDKDHWPKADEDDNWIDYVEETSDDYTLIRIRDASALDIRKNKHGDVAIFLPSASQKVV